MWQTLLHDERGEPPACVHRPGVRDETPARDVGGEVEEVRIGNASRQIVAPPAGGLGTEVAGVRHGDALDELVLLGTPGAGARDGVVAAPDPALMALAVLVAVAAPRHGAQIRSVVVDDVDVAAGLGPASRRVAGTVGHCAMVVLNQNVARCPGRAVAAVLRVQVDPIRAERHRLHLGPLDVHANVSPGRVLRLPVAEES